MKTSRIPGFYKKSIEERRNIISRMHTFSNEEKERFVLKDSLPIEMADKMVENVVGTFSLPLGLGLNFLINNKEYTIPMAIEEPSVVASASYIGKIVRDAGGFTTEASDRMMIGQIQLVGCTDYNHARDILMKEKESLLEIANATYPSIVARGGGAKDLEV